MAQHHQLIAAMQAKGAQAINVRLLEVRLSNLENSFLNDQLDTGNKIGVLENRIGSLEKVVDIIGKGFRDNITELQKDIKKLQSEVDILEQTVAAIDK